MQRPAGKKIFAADEPVRWVRDWLNSRVSHRDISVHLRQRLLSS